MDWPAHLDEAGLLRLEALGQHLLGALPSVPRDRFLLGLAVFVVALLLRRPVGWAAGLVIGRIVGVRNKGLRDDVTAALRPPLGLLAVAVGVFLAFEIIKSDESPVFARFSDQTVGTLFIVAAYWALLSMVTPLITYLVPGNGKLTESVLDWIRKAVQSAVVFFAIAAVLQQWGVRIGPLLAGMGIAGAAVALGAQTLFKNLISGVLILVEERFQYGDWVKVDGVVEGTVESIGFRSTRIRQFDDAAVEVPNSDLADNAVINFTQMRRRRIFWVIGVPYATSVDQLKRIRDGIEAYIHGSDDFVPPDLASTFVRIDSFGASSINIMVYCFTRTTKWGAWLEVKERLACELIDVVEGAGSSFAFPSTSLYVESLPAGRPELFLPPEGGQPRIVAAEAAGAPAGQGAIAPAGPGGAGLGGGSPGGGAPG